MWQQFGPHGYAYGCGEIDCLIQAAQASGKDVTGARITTAQIRGSAKNPNISYLPPCSHANSVGCSNILNSLGIKVIEWK